MEYPTVGHRITDRQAAQIAFEFDGIHIDNYPFFCYAISVSGKKKEIDLLTEISIEEYNEAMDDYIKELKDIPWYADHWRFGGKLPTDPMWKRRRSDEQKIC